MLSQEQLLYIAEPLVKACVAKYLEGDPIHFSLLLFGPFPPYTLESYPEAGHNQYVVLKAIYNYQRKHPEIDIESILETTFIRFQKTVNTVYIVEFFLTYVDAELKYEKETISPFKIITEEFLEETKKQILEKREEIMSDKEDLNFDVWLENLFKGIEERHGIKRSFKRESQVHNSV